MFENNSTHFSNFSIIQVVELRGQHQGVRILRVAGYKRHRTQHRLVSCLKRFDSLRVQTLACGTAEFRPSPSITFFWISFHSGLFIYVLYWLVALRILQAKALQLSAFVWGFSVINLMASRAQLKRELSLVKQFCTAISSSSCFICMYVNRLFL